MSQEVVEHREGDELRQGLEHAVAQCQAHGAKWTQLEKVEGKHGGIGHLGLVQDRNGVVRRMICYGRKDFHVKTQSVGVFESLVLKAREANASHFVVYFIRRGNAYVFPRESWYGKGDYWGEPTREYSIRNRTRFGDWLEKGMTDA